ncbi:hypothetical protein STA3757_05110 [Stanieria sp. NIES-3757]|nr:hypothetical protein STA3757_05110 [Stanieria sp. NIES-3757]
MVLNYSTTRQVLLCFTSAAIGSCTVNVLPSYAVTFSSESFLNSFGFSTTPTEVATNANTNTFTIAGVNSSIEAEAFANSIFFIPPDFLLQCIPNSLVPTPAACNYSGAKIEATGSNFSGVAEGRTEVQGSFFVGSSLIGTNETFSFDFSGFLDLESQIDQVLPRQFQTIGEVAFQVYELDTNTSNLTLLDSFSLAGILNTDSKAKDALITNEASDYITLNTNSNNNFGGNTETISTFFAGNYSRSFNQETRLVFVSSSLSKVTPVPESSSWLSLLGLGLLPFINRKFRYSITTKLAK